MQNKWCNPNKSRYILCAICDSICSIGSSKNNNKKTKTISMQKPILPSTYQTDMAFKCSCSWIWPWACVVILFAKLLGNHLFKSHENMMSTYQPRDNLLQAAHGFKYFQSLDDNVKYLYSSLYLWHTGISLSFLSKLLWIVTCYLLN